MIESLNRVQREVVEAPLLPILVVASAGTGKTKILTERIIYLLDVAGLLPSEILAITFTNLAAEEMRERIHNRLKDSHRIPNSIGTIHALFSEILRRDIEKICSHRNHNFDLLQEEGQIWAIRKALLNLKKTTKLHKSKLHNIRNLISDWKMGKFLKKIKVSDIDLLRYEDVFEEYEKVLLSKNYLDFDDALILAWKLLSTHEDIRDYWKNKFKAILVDECQDLNEIQWQLILSLIPDKNINFFAVGDPNQCIYIFNGAKENIFEEIKTTLPGIITFELYENYRSSKAIVEYSNSLKQIKNKDSVAVSSKLGEVIFCSDLKQALSQLIEHKCFSSWAILFPKHSDVKQIIELLIEHSIPFRISKFYLTEEAVIEKLMNLIRVIFFDNTYPLESLIFSKEFQFTFHTKHELTDSQNIPKGKTFLDFLLNTDDWKFLSLDDVEMQKLEQFINTIREFRALPKHDLAALIPRFSKFLYPVEPIPSVCKKIDLFAKWLRSVQSELTEEAALDIALNFRSYSEFSKEDINKKEHNSVTLSTIHKTKGLEWENVIVLEYEHLENESFNKTKDKHLAYVAATRAKEKLLFVRSTP